MGFFYAKNMDEEKKIEATTTDNLNSGVSGDELRALSFLKNQMQNYITQRSELEREWLKALMLYEIKEVEHYYEGQSKIKPPWVHNDCRAVATRLSETIWGSNENFSYKRMKKNLADFYRAMKTYMNYLFETINEDEDDISNVIDDFTLSIVVYGKGILKVLPIDRTDGDKTRFALNIKNVGIFNLFRDARIPSLYGQHAIIEKIIVPWSHLEKNNIKIYKNLKDEHRKYTYNRQGKSDEEKKKTIYDERGLKDVPVGVDEYELWQCWFWWENVIHLMTMLDGQFIVQPMDKIDFNHKKYPYAEADFEKDLHTAYGKGIPMLTKESDTEGQDNRRQMMDAKTRQLRNNWCLSGYIGVPPRFLTFEQDAVIPVDVSGKLDPLRPPIELISQTIQIERMLSEDRMSTSLSPASFQGLPTRYGTTAFELSQITSQASLPLIKLAKQIEQKAIEPMLDMVYSYIRQYVKQDEIIQVVGKDGFAYPKILRPADMPAELDLIATGAMNVENQLVVTQQVMQLLNLNPLVMGKLKVENCIRKLFEVWGWQDVDNYMVESEQIIISASDENKMLNDLQFVEVHPDDTDKVHIIVCAVGRAMAKKEAYEYFDRHLDDHRKQDERKMMMAMQFSNNQMMVNAAGQEATPMRQEGGQESPLTESGLLRKTREQGKTKIPGIPEA